LGESQKNWREVSAGKHRNNLPMQERGHEKRIKEKKTKTSPQKGRKKTNSIGGRHGTFEMQEGVKRRESSLRGHKKGKNRVGLLSFKERFGKR